MRLAWAVFAVFCGCADLSGLDQLQVADGGGGVDADAGPELDASDAGDAGDASDAAAEVGATTIAIKCGTTVCSKGVCCRTAAGNNTYSYQCLDGALGCGGVAIACDSKTDCSGQEICCITEGTSAQCAAPTIACTSAQQCLAGAGDRELCSNDSECGASLCTADTCLSGYSSCQ